jgi:hypothetical protein
MPTPLRAHLARAAAIAITLALSGAAAAAGSPIEIRVVHDGEPVHLVLPADAPRGRKERDALELDGWDAIAPLARVLRKQPGADTVLATLREHARDQGRVISNASFLHANEDDGMSALRAARWGYRAAPQTAEQVAVWFRGELAPAADALRVRFALQTYAIESKVEDVELELVWHGPPNAGVDAAARGQAWAAEGASAYHAALRAATGALIALFEAGRQDRLPKAALGRGRVAGVAQVLVLVGETDERVLARDDDVFHSAPRAAWTPQP